MAEFAIRRRGFPQVAKYSIREEIGHGAMATVYRALDGRLGREVALKIIHPHLRNSPEVASRFHNEAQAVAKLRHPNIVEVFDVGGPEEPEQYLVVELVHGTTLRRILQERGPMPCEVAALVAAALLDALAHAHASGVIHRDIKPENVLIEHRAISADEPKVTAGGSRASVKLTDFGIAKLLDAQGVTSTGQVLGSPAHMAPEQIEGGEVDGRSDLFGVGVLLYECMVGHLPFEGGNPAQVLRRVLDGTYRPARAERAEIGDFWSKIADRALCRSKTDRFADARAMRGAITGELVELGFWPADHELESYLDDPPSYVARHSPRIAARLCQRAEEARKQGRTLEAAADYNRALANAPDDPGLLRIVARMQRVEARRRALRRWGGALAGATVIGAAVAGLVRRPHDRVRPPPSIAAPPAVAKSPFLRDEPRPQTERAAPSGAPVRSGSTSLGAAAKSVDRRVTLDLIPPMGVSVSVDHQPSRPVSTGDMLTLDSRPHALAFWCSVCVTTQITVGATERDSTLVVSVRVKPAILVIEGEPERTYQIAEHPEAVVRAGTSTIPLKSAFERVTVKEIETGASVSVRLEAGKSVRARFL